MLSKVCPFKALPCYKANPLVLKILCKKRIRHETFLNRGTICRAWNFWKIKYNMLICYKCQVTPKAFYELATLVSLLAVLCGLMPKVWPWMWLFPLGLLFLIIYSILLTQGYTICHWKLLKQKCSTQKKRLKPCFLGKKRGIEDFSRSNLDTRMV